MSRAALAALLTLSSLCASTASAVSVSGVPLSLGRARDATARLTYDRRKAQGGGFVYAIARAEQADDEAIRVSEALLTTSDGIASHAAVSAREHGVPALLLPAARWKDGVLVVDVPSLGPERKIEGAFVRLVESTASRTLLEGAVVTVDAEAGLLRVVAEEEQDEALALAEALRGYEGLRDSQALLNWFAARADAPGAKALAARLYLEVAGRVAEGVGKPEDMKPLARGLGQDGKEAAARESRRWAQAYPSLEASLSTAGTTEALDRLAAQAEQRWGGAVAVCAAAGLRAPTPDGRKLAALARARREALERRGPRTLEETAKGAGASMPAAARLEPALYERFVKETGLSPLIDEVAQDASLRLAQKSERIAAMFAAAKLEPNSEIGKKILDAFPLDSRARVIGEDETIDGVARAKAVEAVKRAWASSWNPAPLGARKRAGGLEPSPTLTILVQPQGETGVLYSRDPASGRRRVTVGWAGDEYVLSLEGRALIPSPAPAARRLSAQRLKALAKLAAALDAHFGGAAQASFAFSIKGEPILLDARFVPPR